MSEREYEVLCGALASTRMEGFDVTEQTEKDCVRLMSGEVSVADLVRERDPGPSCKGGMIWDIASTLSLPTVIQAPRSLSTSLIFRTPIVFPEMITPVLPALVENSKSRAGYVVGMNRDNFYSEYHAALQRAGVRDLPPYSCRHTTATALALGNIAPSVIQEVMRHTKFSTT